MRRKAFTLVELLIVISIIVILMGMVIPAVFRAQRAANNTECKSKLKQMATALKLYEGTYRVLPALFYGLSRGPGELPGNSRGGNGALMMLLPYLQENQLYDSINMSVPFGNPDAVGWGSMEPGRDLVNPNFTAAQFIVDAFICPSDETGKSSIWVGQSSNYVPNRGAPTGMPMGGSMTNVGNGAFVYNNPWNTLRGRWSGDAHPPITSQSCADGVSNTAAFSESLIGKNAMGGRSGIVQNENNRKLVLFDMSFNNEHLDLFPFADSTRLLGPGILQNAMTAKQLCDDATTGGTWIVYDPKPTGRHSLWPTSSGLSTSMRGTSSRLRGGEAMYTHFTLPNGNSCGAAGDGGKLRALAASSHHPDGVNVVFLDGSVSFKTDIIEPLVWWAMGTRSMGD